MDYMSTGIKNVCPKCGYEYESWVEICPDCGTALQMLPASEPVARAASGEPGTDPRWTTVTNVPNAIMGNFLKSQLEDAGIPVIMRRMKSVDIAEFSHNDFVPQDLLVPEHLIAEARGLIDGRPDPEFSVGDYAWQPPAGSEDEQGDEEEDLEPEADGRSSPFSTDLPEGWTMLDGSAGTPWAQKEESETPGGWHWSVPSPQAANAPKQPHRYSETFGQESFQHRPKSERRDLDYSYGPSKWVRLIYALLLLAMSMPFILQVMGQIAHYFTGR